MAGESPKPASAPTGAVFLSYASQDADAARQICDALRAAGIEVWFDQSELRGGDAWDRQIRKQIHDCALFVPLISQHSQERLEGYFRLEWKLAVDRSHRMAAERSFIVPVVVDSTRERDALVPDSFRDVQWTHLPGGEASQAFVARVNTLIGAGAPTAASPGPNTAPVTVAPVRASDRRVVGIPLGLVALVVVMGGAWFAFRHSGLPRHAQANVASQSQPAAPEKSIAVLPFADLSEKHDQEYFADGIADELLDRLTQVPGLKVIGRTSSFQFKGKNEDLRSVGRILGASHVVEGSVRKYGNQVRITAQLVRSADGTHEWSGTYDRNVQNVLQVQAEIAASLARALEISFSPANVAASAGTGSSEAYDLFLKGRHAEDPETRQALTDAEAYYQRALGIDPNFVAAQEALAIVHLIQAANGIASGDSGYPRVKKEATKLLANNPNSRVGHDLICRYDLAYSWNWAEAERECAITRASGEGYQSAELALALGQPAKAEQLFRDILSVDPLDSDALVELSGALISQGRFTEAEAEARKALAANPSMHWARYTLGVALLAQGRMQNALEVFQEESSEAGQQAGLAMAYHSLGRKTEAAAALKRLTEEHGTGFNYTVLAATTAYVGDADRALEWLETAFTEHDPGLQYVKSDWLLKPLHSDPRFKALLQKLNLPE